MVREPFLYVILGAIHQPGTQRQLGSLVRIVHPKLAEEVRRVKESRPAPGERASQVLERFRASVNAQERRMLRAFPHYRWTGREGHEVVMRQVREFQERLRAAAKERRDALKNAKKK